MSEFLKENLLWVREPKRSVISQDYVEIITEPGPDLWQRTYYGFQIDNAPVLLKANTVLTNAE